MYVIIFTNSIRWNQYWSYTIIREEIFFMKNRKMRIAVYNLQSTVCYRITTQL